MQPIFIEFTKSYGNFTTGHRVVVSKDQADRLKGMGVARDYQMAPLSKEAAAQARELANVKVRKSK